MEKLFALTSTFEPPTLPSVFISYRQLNAAQRLRVRDFAERVRGSGIDVVLDQFYKEATPGASDDGWTIWSENQAEDTEKVLIIADHEWFQCYLKKASPGRGLGAAAEAHIIHARITAAGTKAQGIRIVAFDEVAKDSIPFRLRDFPFFDLQQSGVFEEMIAWLGGTAPISASATPTTTLTWPARCTTFLPDMANRHEEFDFFASTLCNSVPQRATLVSAGSDHGKTKLVAEFNRYGCEVLGQDACAFIDFKGRGTVDHIWDTLSLDLGSRLPGLSDRSPGRLREGLRKATAPVLLCFDAFEQGTEEARDFVQKHLLADLSRTNAMRLLIAGQPQAMPDPKKAAWEAHARRYDLGNIPDPQPWVDWAARVYQLIPENSVRTIVACSGGAPGVIANQLAHLGRLSASQLRALGLK